MQWRLTTLIENHPDPDGKLCSEHGLSILIEGGGVKLLMDTGQSGAFFENAKQLGISLSDLTCVLLSHAHYDHANGLLRLINEEGLPKRLLVGKHFFRKCFHQKKGKMHYIGTKFDRRMLDDLRVPIEEIETDTLELADGITIYRNFTGQDDAGDHDSGLLEPLDPHFMYQEEEPSCGPFGRCMDSLEYKPDTFEDELVVTLDTRDGLLVVCGCSHPGILRILRTIQRRSGKNIYGVIGGTHLMAADDARVESTAKAFREMGIRLIGVSHCTGESHVQYLKDYFGDDFILNCTGNVIEV